MDPSSKSSRLSFAAVTLAVGLLLAKSMLPPQPLAIERTEPDTLFDGPLPSAHLLFVFRAGVIGLSFLNALASISGSPTHTAFFGRLGQHAAHLDKTFVTWNKTSAATLTLIATSSWVRLQAMRGLGERFTFDLVQPSQLVTNGMYEHVQHPSYTAGILSLVGGIWLFVRPNGGLGPFLPPRVFEFANKAQWAMWVSCGGFICAVIAVRVREEEAMLRKQFGQEWEEWHRRTARFVPFVF